MRISDAMIAANITRRLAEASERLFRLQEQVASGLAFTRPSEHPSGAVRAAALRSTIAETNRYLANGDAALANLRLTEAALVSIYWGLEEARVAGLAMSEVSADGNAALATQVQNIARRVVGEANAASEGRYLFAGYRVLSPPVAPNAGGVPPYLYQGDRGDQPFQLGRDLSIVGNLDAAEILNFDGAADPGLEDALESLRKLEVALRAGDREGAAEAIAAVEQHARRVLALRGELGAKMQHVTLAKTRLEDTGLVLRSLLSEQQDADLTRVVIDLRAQEVAYQAAAAAASALHRASLLDYLR